MEKRKEGRQRKEIEGNWEKRRNKASKENKWMEIG